MNTPLSTYHPDVLRQRLVDLGEDWADKDSAANLMEETRKTVLAELSAKSRPNCKSHAEAENAALADAAYAEHIRGMVEARRVANRAKVNYDAARVWVEMARTAEATRRHEMGLR